MGNNLSLSLEIQDDVVNRINNYINALKKTLSTQLKKAPTLYHYTKLRKAFCLNPEANVSDQIHDEECIALFSEICKYHQANFLQEQCSIVFQQHSVNREIGINKNSSISQTAVQILRSKIKLRSKVSQASTASTSENFMTSKSELLSTPGIIASPWSAADLTTPWKPVVPSTSTFPTMNSLNNVKRKDRSHGERVPYTQQSRTGQMNFRNAASKSLESIGTMRGNPDTDALLYALMSKDGQK